MAKGMPSLPLSATVLDLRVESFSKLLSLTYLQLRDQFARQKRVSATLVGRTLDGHAFIADLEPTVAKLRPGATRGEVVARIAGAVRPMVRDFTLDMALLAIPVPHDQPTDQALIVHSDGHAAHSTLVSIATGESGDAPRVQEESGWPGVVIDPAKYLPLDLLNEAAQQREDPRAVIRSQARWVLALWSYFIKSSDSLIDVALQAGRAEYESGDAFRGVLVVEEKRGFRVVLLASFGSSVRPHVMSVIAREITDRLNARSAALVLPGENHSLHVIQQTPLMHESGTYPALSKDGTTKRRPYLGPNPLGYLALQPST